ncbi:cob(I)yrinic acid a,c-diamide adenosyltransferase [Micropruina sp.]|uniref:cob(I)yrinic acid a,c-diamide adenosyltransferase n=1 Tax=Micropruina sp. TaxID=2737536 RepID=UPI002602A71B|nr:cob(I)yrinic acid a,c-diamide adenosyltransferase [Micropruina sp.]
MVNLTRIYTRTGDAGMTRLSDMSETAKTDLRVEAYGAVDEANSILGMVVTQPDLPEDVRAVLRHIQNELFDAGADLSFPLVADPPYEPLRIVQASIDRLEGWCDAFGDPLPALRSFILPGGSFTAALLHQARSVVRRAEREAWRAAEQYGTEPAERPFATDAGGTGNRNPARRVDEGSEESKLRDRAEGEPATTAGGVNPLAITYLNRLSDLLFILARVVGQEAGDVLWVPGADRTPSDPSGVRQRRRLITEPSTTHGRVKAGPYAAN